MNNFPNIYPSQAIDMVSIGERTGNLYIMLNHIAKIFELEIEDFIKRLSVTIEPLLMIFMGLIVGSIALSIILPIYEVTNHLQK
jgi:type II secretory pathway component PulF